MAARREAALLADVARFVLVIPRANAIPDDSLPEFERVVRLPIRSLTRRFGDIIAYAPALLIASLQLSRLLGRTQCSRLQINDMHLLHGWVVRLFGFRGRIVTWVRMDPLRFGVIGRIWIAIGWHTGKVVAVSQFIRNQLNRRALLLYDPAPLWRHNKSAVGELDRLIFVGNYVHGKGQDDAIRAFTLIARDYPHVRLAFHGGDLGLAKNRDYLRRLKKLAAASGFGDRIEFHGFAEDVRSVFRPGDIALNFSHSESFSFTVLEACAAGNPVIATRSGGPEEIIEDGKSGFLVAVGDVEAMAHRIVWFLNRPQEARAIGMSARTTVQARFANNKFRREAASVLGLGPDRPK